MRSLAYMNWFSHMLLEIARAAKDSSIELHMSIFVTSLSKPGAVPSIPNCDIFIERPPIQRLLHDFISSAGSEKGRSEIPSIKSGGDLAVCAAGPEAMTREVNNTIARLTVSGGMQVGKVACHTELYSL